MECKSLRESVRVVVLLDDLHAHTHTHLHLSACKQTLTAVHQSKPV